MGNNIEGALRRAAAVMEEADSLVISAGAGMGVDSGMPDFRGPEGFWKAYPPYAKLRLSFEQVANPRHFALDASLGWGFYGHRMNLYWSLVPHDGFRILKKWAEQKTQGYFVFTSNVDGHFQKAGFPDDRILECHGSIEHRQCLVRCGSEIFEASSEPIVVSPETFRASPPLPICQRCGGLARPNILMFGDYDWDSTRTRLQEARFEAWIESLESPRIAVIELGAGVAIATVRRFSEGLVSALGATLIRINVRDPQVPRDQIGIPMGALEALQSIDDEVKRSGTEGFKVR